MQRIIVVGCGGGGSRLAPEMVMLVGKKPVLLIDGDALELKNLDRQLFNETQVGMNKAEAMSDRCGLGFTGFRSQYFNSTLAHELDIRSEHILFCCADNHACRRAVLEACDQYGCRCCILGNEYTDAEAYWYEAEWKFSPNDPRVFYPSIRTDNDGDPLRPEGCTGEAREKNRQLGIANGSAVTMALMLYWFHEHERPDLPRTPEAKANWPVHNKVNKWQFTTITYSEKG